MKGNNQKHILLSVIIPVYNTQKFLPRCLDSLIPGLDTSAFRTEIIVVNDGSPDESLSVIEDYKNRYPHLVFVIDQKNGGLSAARNSGLRIAQGKYLWFIDSDDLAESAGVPQILEALSTVDADYFTVNAARVDEKDKVCGEFSLACSASTEPAPFDFTYQQLMGKFSSHMVWMRIYSREFVGGLEFPVGITHEDIHFDIKVLSREPRVYHTGIVGYRHYFDNPDSITNNMNEKKFRSILWVYKDLQKWISQFSNGAVARTYAQVMFVGLIRTQYYIFNTHIGFADKVRLASDFQSLQLSVIREVELPKTIYKKEKVYFWLLKTGALKLALLFLVVTA